MSQELLDRLRFLEEEYPNQPTLARRADLHDINDLRARLGMPQVDDKLHEIGVQAAVQVVVTTTPEPVIQDPHAEGRAIYQAYVDKNKMLEPHRRYAQEVAAATYGRGQTPVRPLATMGTSGGPLLCDYCHKPIVLESHPYHGMNADDAWRLNPDPEFRSWILGGVVIEVASNGTLRVYHGYPHRYDRGCCNLAAAQEQQVKARFKSDVTTHKYNVLMAFLAHEFPKMTEKEQVEMASDVLCSLYTYDPGTGINRPDQPS